jgi:hypothetical protein
MKPLRLHKLNLGLLATITLEAVPFRTYAPFPALLPFFKCFLQVMFCEGVQHRLWFCLYHLSCQNGGLSVLYSFWGTEKSRVCGVQQSCCFLSNSLVKKVVWDGALSWSNSQFFCHQSWGRSLCTFSRSHHKTSQYYAELTVWPTRTNFLWTIPLKSKKIRACSWLCS